MSAIRALTILSLTSALAACGGADGGGSIASTPPPGQIASTPPPGQIASAPPPGPASSATTTTLTSSSDFAVVTAPITATHRYTGIEISQSRLAFDTVRYSEPNKGDANFEVGKDDSGGYSIGLDTTELGTIFDGERVGFGVTLPANARWSDPSNPDLIRYKARLTTESTNQSGDLRLDFVDTRNSGWGDLQYTALGLLNYCNPAAATSCGGATSFAALVFGQQTPSGATPLSGSADYQGRFLATDWGRTTRLDGDVALQLNFATRDVIGSLTKVGLCDCTGPGTTTSLGDFTLAGQIGPSGMLNGVVHPPVNSRFLDGTWGGGFFGPHGQEVGGVLQLPQQGTAEAVLGVFGVVRKP